MFYHCVCLGGFPLPPCNSWLWIDAVIIHWVANKIQARHKAKSSIALLTKHTSIIDEAYPVFLQAVLIVFLCDLERVQNAERKSSIWEMQWTSCCVSYYWHWLLLTRGTQTSKSLADWMKIVRVMDLNHVYILLDPDALHVGIKIIPLHFFKLEFWTWLFDWRAMWKDFSSPTKRARHRPMSG